MSDYIKREKALEIVKRTCGDYASAWSEISRIQSEDVAPVVHGKWEPYKSSILETVRCSNCQKTFQYYYGDYQYCPRCGAKMDLE